MQKRYYFSKIILVSHYFYQIMIMFRPLCPKKKRKFSIAKETNQRKKKRNKWVWRKSVSEIKIKN